MYEHGFKTGYFKALLDMYNYFDRAFHPSSMLGLKSKKQSQNFTKSLLLYLAQNFEARERFREYGGDIGICVDPKTFEVKEIIDD